MHLSVKKTIFICLHFIFLINFNCFVLVLEICYNKPNLFFVTKIKTLFPEGNFSVCGFFSHRR